MWISVKSPKLLGISDADIKDGVVDIPKGVSVINTIAFIRQATLKRLNKTDQIKKIGGSAFSYSGITIIILPNLETIGSSAFSGCAELTSITLPDNNQAFDEIKVSTFKGCKKLTALKIPASVKKIGTEALSGSGIEQLEICHPKAEIGDRACADCPALTEITLFDTVTVALRAFNNCPNINSITILFDSHQADYSKNTKTELRNTLKNVLNDTGQINFTFRDINKLPTNINPMPSDETKAPDGVATIKSYSIPTLILGASIGAIGAGAAVLTCIIAVNTLALVIGAMIALALILTGIGVFASGIHKTPIEAESSNETVATAPH